MADFPDYPDYDFFISELDGPNGSRRGGVRRSYCSYCHTTGLYWGKHEGKWRLFGEGRALHTCKEYAKSAGTQAWDNIVNINSAIQAKEEQ